MDPRILAQPASTPARPAAVGPRLSVVVVNYRQWGDTARLVRQLRRSISLRDGHAEILVVDNAPRPDPRLGRVRKPGVSLHRNRRNHGFARAVNAGCDQSRGSWVLLLNPDITLADEFLDRVVELIDELEARPEVGIVGLGLRNDDGSPQLSTGPFPTLTSTLFRLFLPRASRKYHRKAHPQRAEVDWVTGCCLLVRRACWEQLGGFDPAFFLYYEDVDLCQRARQAGWVVLHEPTLTVTHHLPLHSRDVPPHLRLITRHALLTYARKHWRGWQARLLASIVRLEGWARMLWAGLWGQRQERTIFSELAALAGDVAAGRTPEAERRLQRIVRHHEETAGDTAPVGDRSHS
jgi:GT2 family glycosyltransferase